MVNFHNKYTIFFLTFIVRVIILCLMAHCFSAVFFLEIDLVILSLDFFFRRKQIQHISFGSSQT